MKYSLAALFAALLIAGCTMDQFSPIPYEQADINQDGYVVFDEYYYLMSRIEATPPYDLGQAWNSADDNHDGVVTRYEHWSNLFPANVVYRLRSYL